MWREASTFLENHTLACVPCMSRKSKEKLKIEDVDADGKVVATWCYGLYTDQILGRVPAFLTAEMDTYWGYTSVPEDRVVWWRSLPTLPPKDLA